MALDELRDFSDVLARHDAARQEIEGALGPELMAEIRAARAALERAVARLDPGANAQPGNAKAD